MAGPRGKFTKRLPKKERPVDPAPVYTPYYEQRTVYQRPPERPNNDGFFIGLAFFILLAFVLGGALKR